MNCNCIKETEGKLLERGEWEGRKIVGVGMKDLMYTFGTNGGKSGTLTYQEFEVELEGLKRPKRIKVSHTFCPYCGIKVGKLDPDQQDNNPLE